MKTIKLSGSIIFICILSACQKEINDESIIVPPPPSSVADSNYIHKIYDLYDNGAGIDTQEIITVHYDNLKRIISMEDSLVTTTGMEFFSAFTYYYNGTDTLPNKSLQVIIEASSMVDSSTKYHFYDTQGRKIKDSLVRSRYDLSGHSFDINVTQYSFGANKLFGQRTATNILPGNVPAYSRDTAILNTDGDILTSKRYEFDGTDYILNVTANFTYDNHPSPFAKRSSFMAHRQFPNGETIFIEHFGYTNTLSQDETVIFPAYTFNGTSTFTYNAAGYPTEQNSIYNTNVEKLIYTYKSL